MNIKGQSLVEGVFVIPLILGFWVALVWFGLFFIRQIEMLHTARHGVMCLIYRVAGDQETNREAELVRQECLNFLHRQDPSLDLNKVSVQVQAGDRWKPWGPWKLLQNPLGFFGTGSLAEAIPFGWTKSWFFAKCAGIDKHPDPASVTVVYDMPAPPLMKRIPGFPTSIRIRGFCVCYR